MTNLNNIFGLPKAKQQDSTHEEAKPAPAPSTANPFAKVAQASTSLPSVSNPFGAKLAQAATTATSPQTEAGGATSVVQRAESKASGIDEGTSGVGGGSGADDFGFDLSSLDVSDVKESRDRDRPTRSVFPDEVPATAPIRAVDPDASKEVKQFVELIDNVYKLWDDPELLSNVIRSIMIELKSNPQYMNLVAKDDVTLWVRAMRENMGLAQIKKQESKAKRKSGGAKAKVGDAEMMDIAAGLGLDFDNL